MTRPPSRRQRQSGATLIEILIAALILAVGMLGVGAMQAAALRNSQSSLERSQAVLETYAILDTMRANLIAARAGAYNMPLTCAPIVGGTRAEVERAAWHQGLQGRLGENACARIACADNVCTIELQWDDSRGTAGDTEQEIITVSQL
ncbi:MAG TPA: type IV pilus modification protein PilV [Xanthomonadaceae bacterium]|jgi:type IV pilus assembly protein PilV|nr:type IV pilus modification protein PilV [Xanthomonadaceae bacterium]